MNNNMYQMRPPYQNGNNDRFIFPFLTGALVGGAAVGLTRPRPIYNVAPGAPGGNPGLVLDLHIHLIQVIRLLILIILMVVMFQGLMVISILRYAFYLLVIGD